MAVTEIIPLVGSTWFYFFSYHNHRNGDVHTGVLFQRVPLNPIIPDLRLPFSTPPCYPGWCGPTVIQHFISQFMKKLFMNSWYVGCTQSFIHWNWNSSPKRFQRLDIPDYVRHYVLRIARWSGFNSNLWTSLGVIARRGGQCGPTLSHGMA